MSQKFCLQFWQFNPVSTVSKRINHCENPNIEIRSPKWFDRPFDRLTAMSSVEWLTILSEPVESLKAE